MKPRWTRGLDTEEKNPGTLKAEFEAAESVRKRLGEMLQEDIDESLKRMRGFVESQPNLTEAYAAELAKQQTLLDILKLIEWY